MITRRMKPQQGADMLTLRTEEVSDIPDNEAHVGYENFIQSHKPYSWDSKDI